MYGIAFKIFGLSIHWYGIMVAAGFLSSLVLLQYKREYARMTSDQIVDLSIIIVVCGILGARIAYVIQFWEQFQNNIWHIVRIDQGGLVFYGGFILAAIVIYLYIRKHKLKISRILDICAPAMAIGHAFGRIGCFLQGCCFGRPCGSFGYVYAPGSAPAARFPDLNSVAENLSRTGHAVASSLPLIPVQLMESAGNILIGVIALLLFRKVRKTGLIASFYFVSYGVLRFILEFFRGDHLDNWAGLTRAQWTGLVIMIPLGIIGFFFFRKYGENVGSEPAKS